MYENKMKGKENKIFINKHIIICFRTGQFIAY